jgi:TonB family protein
MNERRKRNSSKVNLILSLIFHSALLLAVVFFAARAGIIGKRMQTIVAVVVHEPKAPEPPKKEPVAPKAIEAPKALETPKFVNAAPAPPRVESAAPPPAEAAPAVAPAAVSLPAFEFNDGAKEVVSVSDPKALYRGMVEHALRARWNRPEDIADDKYVAEVELSVDGEGNVTGSRWLKGSGDARWDKSVKEAVTATKAISRPPPKGFPGAFIARFDVETSRVEEFSQLSAR